MSSERRNKLLRLVFGLGKPRWSIFLENWWLSMDTFSEMTWNDRTLEVGDDQIHTLTRIYAIYIYAPSGKPNMAMETSPWLKMCFLMWIFSASRVHLPGVYRLSVDRKIASKKLWKWLHMRGKTIIDAEKFIDSPVGNISFYTELHLSFSIFSYP